MDYIRTTKALAVAAVLALIVVVAVIPLTDDLAEGRHEAAYGTNDAACLVSEAAEGYETEITLVGTTAGGIRSASLTVDGDELVLYGSEARIWLMDTGAVLATSTGLYTPFDPDGASDGTTVKIGSGAATSGESSQGYGLLLVPSETGTLGLFVEPFRITSLAGLYMVAGQHVGSGTAASVTPLSESDEGEFAVSGTAGDGSTQITGGTYTEDGRTVQASAFVAPVEYYAGIEESGQDAASRIMSAVPVIILVGLAAFVAVAMGGRR